MSAESHASRQGPAGGNDRDRAPVPSAGAAQCRRPPVTLRRCRTTCVTCVNRPGRFRGGDVLRSRPLVTGDSAVASHRARPLPVCSAGGSRDPGEVVAAGLVTLVPAARDLRLRNRPAAALTSRLPREGNPEGNRRRTGTGQRPKGPNRRTPDEGKPGTAGEGGRARRANGKPEESPQGYRRTCGEAPDHPVRARGSGAACICDAAGTVPASLRELRIVVQQLSGGQQPACQSRAPDAALPESATTCALCGRPGSHGCSRIRCRYARIRARTQCRWSPRITGRSVDRNGLPKTKCLAR